jgi:hypothetical protein
MSSWQALKDELDLWQKDRRIATFWWRDDDLNEVTPAFDRLLQLRAHLDIPLTLAVIPDRVDPHIADDLDGCHFVQHGVLHKSFAQDGEKKSEFPATRDSEAIKRDILSGRQRLETLFEDTFLPFFVPPWNRMDDRHVSALADLGFTGISQYNPRKSALVEGCMAQINTHVDPVFWRGDRSALPDTKILADMCSHLAQRRLGEVDSDEPTGFLTHHLVHDEALWEISHKLLSFLNAHVSVRWLTLPGAMSLIDGLPDPDEL